eukprot:1382297-Rhodomonas_salina.4
MVPPGRSARRRGESGHAFFLPPRAMRSPALTQRAGWFQFSAVPKASKVFAQNKINSMTCNNMLVTSCTASPCASVCMLPPPSQHSF